MPWLTMDDAANRLNQPRSEVERRIACGEIRSKKYRRQLLAFVPDEDGPTEGSFEIDTDRIAKAVERIVAAAQQLETVADAQTEKLRFETGAAATLEGALGYLQTAGKRSEAAARAEARRARLGARRARRLLRRWGAVAAAALAVLATWTAVREGRYRRAAEALHDERAELIAAMDEHQSRLDQEYQALHAVIDARCAEASESAAAAFDLVARIEGAMAQWRVESEWLVCEIDAARAEYETLRQSVRMPGISLEADQDALTLQDILDETWGIGVGSGTQVVGPSSESPDGLARR